MLEVTSSWKSAFPGACVGVLALRHAGNPARHPELERRKAEVEEHLRSQFSGLDRTALTGHPILQAYSQYYKRFKKTYHVQLQLESIAWEGKSIPGMPALVQSMFMAEMKNLLLTAGHDLDTLSLPLVLDVSKGTEHYTLMRGEEQILKTGDMMIRDQNGVISSIIYGPDRRTQITANTRNAVFTVYAPAGIGEQAVQQHLMDIQETILTFSPGAQMELLRVFSSLT
jgi:DNA/RNA-binding domain of Phe-tRNA-synthetase-like protein